MGGVGLEWSLEEEHSKKPCGFKKLKGKAIWGAQETIAMVQEKDNTVLMRWQQRQNSQVFCSKPGRTC